MKRWLLVLLLITPSLFAINLQPLTTQNQTIFNTITKNLSTKKIISGHFQQIRTMKLLSHPLISSGHFVLSKNSGLRWVQTKPFPSTLIVTNSIIEQQLPNTPTTIITKKEQPLVFSFTKIFLAIFNGDIQTIQDNFNISFSGSKEQWFIELEPKSTLLKKALLKITLTGSDTIKQVTIQEPQDNNMTIKFF